MNDDSKIPNSELRTPRSRVLVVDDEKSIRLTLRAFLQADGYDVEIAEDVPQALGLLARNPFDVVVSDIVLPKVSGVALLKQLRASASDIQVIMMTGEPGLETAVEAVRAGARDYLTKPVSKHAILQAVASATTIKALEDDKRRLEAEKRKHQNNLENLVEQRTHDLTHALTKLQKAQEQLIQQERMNALGQMASGIAHDFNNVLMPIIGFSEMLLTDPAALDDREETIHMIEMIQSAGNDARHIVSRLRQIYKEEEPDFVPVDLAKVIESVISITMPKWKEEMNAKGAPIEMAVDIADMPLIQGDISELREIFTNLIFNAVDAMPNGGTITFRVKGPTEHGVVLEVTDTGTGMDEQALHRCTEPFFTTKGMQGTGLGLSMTHGIIERHGGTMNIASEPGIGTTIQLRFPVNLDAEAVANLQKVTPDPVPPLRVLVVDDEARSRELVAKLLTTDGHGVEMASGGKEGLEMFHKGEFDLVITDRAMPSMGGDEVARSIRKAAPTMPIIMLTGFGDIMKDKGECPFGVSRVMTKPISQNDLRHVMSEVM
jgi:signal transduction histidine kinase